MVRAINTITAARWWSWLVAAGFGVMAVALGQSANWDLLNYHLYNPHALLGGRHALDILPAQLQTWHNPALHLPYYLGYVALPHALLSFLAGAAAGLLYLPLLSLTTRLLPASAPRPLVALVALLGLMGPMFLSELGTSFADVLLGHAILWPLLWLLGGETGRARLFAAGAIFGAGVGLKWVLVSFAPGMLLVLLAATREGWSCRLLLFVLGATAGFLVCCGWWNLQLYQWFGNPVFPYFNQWFDSEWARPQAYRDARFAPQSWSTWLAKPVIAPVGQWASALELKFRDPRPLLLVLTLPVLLLFRPAAWTRRVVLILGFVFLGWMSWSALSGYYRYLAPIEVLYVPLLAALWLRAAPARQVSLVVALLLSQLVVKVPGWGRVAYGELRPVVALAQPGQMLLTAGSGPTGVAGLWIPPSVPMLRVSGNFHRPDDGSRWSQQVAARIEDWQGPFRALLVETEHERVVSDLAAVGLGIMTDSCQQVLPAPLPALDSNLLVCDATHLNRAGRLDD